MATPSTSITSVDGRRCTRVPRSSSRSTTHNAASSTAPVVSVVSSSTLAVSQPTSSSSNPGLPLTPGRSHNSHSTASLSAAAISGIIIGALIGIGIAACMLFCCVKRRRRRENLNEKGEGEGNATPSSSHPTPGLGEKWAAFAAGLGARLAGLKRNNHSNGHVRRIPHSPYLGRQGDLRSSFSSDNSTRHFRSASTPAPSRFLAFKDRVTMGRFKRKFGRERAMSTDSVPSFYTPTPPAFANPPILEDPFRDPELTRLRITNPDASGSTTPMRTSRQDAAGGLVDQQRGPLTPGSATWRQPTPDFQFPLRTSPENPFLDPPPAVKQAGNPAAGAAITTKSTRRKSISTPDRPRQAHTRTRSSTTEMSSHQPSSYYSEDSGYNSPHAHPSAAVTPLRPTKENPFHDRNEAPNPLVAGIYLLPSSRPTSSGSARSLIPLPTSSTTRSSWLSPDDVSGSSSGSTTAMSRATRGKSDPFDLDRPEVLRTSSFENDHVPELPDFRGNGGANWWRGWAADRSLLQNEGVQ